MPAVVDNLTCNVMLGCRLLQPIKERCRFHDLPCLQIYLAGTDIKETELLRSTTFIFRPLILEVHEMSTDVIVLAHTLTPQVKDVSHDCSVSVADLVWLPVDKGGGGGTKSRT